MILVHLVRVAAVAAFVTFVPACASTSSGGDASATATCSARTKRAQAAVQTAIDANLTCAADADCTSVAFATKCFDACSRVVGTGGAAAVARAVDAENAGECATFADECGAVASPPCLPPALPACHAGRCE